MQKSFIAIALALTLTSAFAAYTASNYVTTPISVAADNDTSYTNQSAISLASITSGNVYLYAGSFTFANASNRSAASWSLFYRQLNTKSLLSTANNSATPVAPAVALFLNNYVYGFGFDTSSGAPNLYVYQTPLSNGTTTPGRIQLSNNTNVNWTVTYLASQAIGNIVYVVYGAANLTANITSFTIGSTTPGTPFTLSTSFDTPISLSLAWGEALGSKQIFAVWIENSVLKDAVINVGKGTVGTVTVVPGYNSSNQQACTAIATDTSLYGEFCLGVNLVNLTVTYYVRTTANGTLVQVATYPFNTSTLYGTYPYGPYLAVFFKDSTATTGVNYAYEIWNLATFNATSVQARKQYLNIDSGSTQVPFRVVSGGLYTLLYNNAPINTTTLQKNGTITNVQVGLVLGSSYLASVLGFLLTIVAGLFLF
jgi:hypothetical protein